MLPLEKRIKIFVGATGSGKTEWSLNLALWLRREGRDLYLIDLDIINPYFTIRERRNKIESLGIKVLTLPEKALFSDLPIVPPQVFSAIFSKLDIIIDVGGDKRGARALAQFAPSLKKTGFSMYMVVNVFRPQTSSVDAILNLARSIEMATGLKITAFINNSNMLDQTEKEHVLRGQALLREASMKSGIKLIGSSILRDFKWDLSGIDGGLWRIEKFLSNAWEVSGGGKGCY
ncbi:MAG: hypothetical protein J7M13_04715 [Synergistetes bacterium]|nr:hypothetical protein [Synergistota bacterium]